jgi:hypothetical protein
VGLKVDDEENVSLRIISTSEFGFANLANYKCLMQSQHGAKPSMKSYLNLQNLPFYELFAISLGPVESKCTVFYRFLLSLALFEKMWWYF